MSFKIKDYSKMSKFTSLKELEAKVGNDKDLEAGYASDESQLPMKRITLPKEKMSAKETAKDGGEKKSKLGGALSDVLVAAVAFILVANPITTKKILGKFSTKSLISEDEDGAKTYHSGLGWKGLGIQVLAFIVIIIIAKALSYFGII